jgi:hypothetical protein
MPPVLDLKIQCFRAMCKNVGTHTALTGFRLPFTVTYDLVQYFLQNNFISNKNLKVISYSSARSMLVGLFKTRELNLWGRHVLNNTPNLWIDILRSIFEQPYQSVYGSYFSENYDSSEKICRECMFATFEFKKVRLQRVHQKILYDEVYQFLRDENNWCSRCKQIFLFRIKDHNCCFCLYSIMLHDVEYCCLECCLPR